MELFGFLLVTHGVLIWFIYDGQKKSNAKTDRINKITKKVFQNMTKEEIAQWWKEFYQGDK